MMNVKTAYKKLEAEQNKLSKIRDSLRDLSNDIDEQIESVEDALESLGYCIDRLSEYV